MALAIKKLLPSEQMRPDVALARRFWITRRQSYMRNNLEKLTFIPSRQIALQSPARQGTKHPPRPT